jgi:hypothetical protein|tara:strand:- start:317 stop:781 length:465 start_codon:yes stop_codon:yes gene_type:complete
MYLPQPNVLAVLGYYNSKQVLFTERNPEEQLFCYVVLNCIEDVLVPHSDRKSALLKCEAHNWLVGNSRDFNLVCDWALLEPEHISQSYIKALQKGLVKFTTRQVKWQKYYNNYLELKSINIREKRRRKGELKRLREEVHQSTTTFTSTIYMSVI